MEVLFSVFLVSVGITTIFALITLGTKKSIENRLHLVAAMLSQEGIEMVRNIRDNNAKKSLDSFTGMPEGNYTINYSSASLISGGSTRLYYDNGFYKHGGGTSSQYSRRIIITGTGDQRTVYSATTWGEQEVPDTVSEIESDCKLHKKCAFSKVSLNKWRE